MSFLLLLNENQFKKKIYSNKLVVFYKSFKNYFLLTYK